jgi:hypothetical protein
MVFFQVL